MTTCGLPIQVGQIELTADGLADLSIDCASGFAALELQVGFPSPRPVTRVRALGDGILDDSAWFGNRAITLSLRLDTSIAPAQTLVDQLLPFLAQSRRPRLAWRMGDTPYPTVPPSVPGSFSDARWRSAVVRGADAPVVISGPRYWTIVLSWTSVGAYLETRELSLWGITPNGAVVNVWNQGNAPAPWVATFTGNAITPKLIVNGVQLFFPAYTAAAGKLVTIDLAARTMIETNQVGPPSPVNIYPQSNSYNWSWSDLYIQPGVNTVEYDTGLPVPANNAQLNFRDAWL